MQETINLRYFGNDSNNHCGYCDSQQSVSLGFVCDFMKSLTYEKLMNKGWRRCGTYFYKPKIGKSCCMSYTIRLDTKAYLKDKKAHRKAAKRMLQFLKMPELCDKNFKLEDLVKNFRYKPKQCPQKNNEIIQQQTLNKIEPQKQKMVQQQKMVSEIPQKQKMVQQQKMVDEIPENFKIQFLAVFKRLLEYVNENNKEFSSCFKEYFEQNGVNEKDQCLQIDPKILEEQKLFISDQNKSGDFYSNILMLIYGRNKKTIFQKLSVEQFSSLCSEFINNFLQQQKEFSYNINRSGYLCIFLAGHEQKAQKEIIRTQNQFQKLNQFQEQKQIQQEKQVKETIKLIDYDPSNWMSNKFTIGNMQVVLKKASLEKDAHQLYMKYCENIHKKPEKSESSYKSFLCEQSLESTVKKSSIDNKTLMFLGCYHMCYYIKDRLVAIGVVDFTPNVLSSVYFFYDPLFEEQFQFGTFSALVEIEYIKIMSNYFPNFRNYYMGFYIQSSQKMVYKGDFGPSELLCPLTYTWVSLNQELKEEIDKRIKQKIQDRKLRLSDENVKLIDDMDITNINQLKFFKENVKVYLKKEVYFIGEFNEKGIQQLYPCLMEALKCIGKELMSEILFSI